MLHHIIRRGVSAVQGEFGIWPTLYQLPLNYCENIMEIYRRGGGDASPDFGQWDTYRNTPTSGPNICIILSFFLVSSKKFLHSTPCPEKKRTNSILGITSSNTDRFRIFFHFYNPLEICNKVVVKYPIAPKTRHYTTLWNINVRNLACPERWGSLSER